MFNNKQNHFETWEDFDATPAGKALLRMPEVWEEGTYPKKPEAPGNIPPQPPEKSVGFKAAPHPFPPVKRTAVPSLDDARMNPDRDSLHYFGHKRGGNSHSSPKTGPAAQPDAL